MSKVLTFISESLFHLSNLYFLLIRQNLGWLPIRHEFEGVGTRHREGYKSNTNVANHGECRGVVRQYVGNTLERRGMFMF